MKASFKKNYIHYFQEALGLAIFMVSACFFSGILEAKISPLHAAIQNNFLRILIMGVAMGATALFIFYSPYTAPSGSHINPAVTITFLRLGKMNKSDSLFYIIFQLLGGTLAVYAMAVLMGETLTASPVNYAVTVPGKFGTKAAAFIEFIIAFIMMLMILFTSADERFKKYTRIFSGCMVCIFVIVAAPISGFGMNPAMNLGKCSAGVHLHRLLDIHDYAICRNVACCRILSADAKTKNCKGNKINQQHFIT